MRLRSLATAAAVLALAAPLTSCGFDYATERDYTPAGGSNNREGVVDLPAGLEDAAPRVAQVVLPAGHARLARRADPSHRGAEALPEHVGERRRPAGAARRAVRGPAQERDDRRVPYWEGGPTYAGWAYGYYASWRGSTLVADIVTSKA